MRKLLIPILLCTAVAAAQTAAVPASAPSVTYVGGTLTTPTPGSTASLELSNPDALVLHTPTSTTSIPWKSVTQWGCFRQNTHQLGVLPMIAAGLFAARMHDHFFHLAWQDEQGHDQAILIQVPLELPKTLHVVLEAHTAVKAMGDTPGDGEAE
jgi:hypothetical protein